MQIVLQRVNSHVDITIGDTGQGIPPDFLPYVFDRFRQADATTTRRYGGLGLGLSIVKQLVDLHGGKVEAKSEGEGQGATFCVQLPLTVLHTHTDGGSRLHPSSSSAADESANPLSDLSGLKVLVVDDEPDARELIRRVLTACHAEVTTASSAAEGLTMVELAPTFC